MGLASKIQASRPAGVPSQSQFGQQSGSGQQQSSYGQAPPYPVSQPAPNPSMSTKPGGYSASQPSANPFAGQTAGRPQQSQYSSAPYGKQPLSAQQQPVASQTQSYGPPQGQYGQAPNQYGQTSSQYGQAPNQYDQTSSQYGQSPNQYGQTQGQYDQASNQYGQTAPNSGGQANQYGQAPQQANYGQPQNFNQSGLSSGAGPNPSIIRDNLMRIIRENQLEMFYPQQRIMQVVQNVEAIDFRALAAEWDIPMEIATDLAALALYDIVLYCDDSGSMRAEERGERIDDLKLILSRVSEIMTKFDSDGIQVRFMNSEVQGNGVRTAAEANQLVQQVRFSGITPLGSNLDRKIVQPLVMQQIRSRALQKPVLVIVITDGEPVGEPRDMTRKVIIESTRAAAQQGFPGALRFQFAQVGKDMKAQAFLSELDNDTQIGRFIDATSYFELEAMEMEKKGVNLTPDLWLVKLCVGAIDSTYDAQDE